MLEDPQGSWREVCTSPRVHLHQDCVGKANVRLSGSRRFGVRAAD
jgi:hypothetical protein